MTASQTLATRTDVASLRALVELLLSSEAARSKSVALHHPPETLARAPAKIEILVNSVVVFVERGFGQVTVQDLLDSARISRRTFYKYFRNKVDVLESLYKLSVDIMVLRFKADMGRAASVPDVARHFVDVFFAYHHELAPVIRMMQEEALRPDSPLAPHRRAGIDTVVMLTNQELQRITGKQVDALLIRSLYWALEGSSIDFLRTENASVAGIEKARQVMSGMATATLESAITHA